jgi:hypothetical protein
MNPIYCFVFYIEDEIEEKIFLVFYLDKLPYQK